jgi:hypothetical protein
VSEEEQYRERETTVYVMKVVKIVAYHLNPELGINSEEISNYFQNKKVLLLSSAFFDVHGIQRENILK